MFNKFHVKFLFRCRPLFFVFFWVDRIFQGIQNGYVNISCSGRQAGYVEYFLKLLSWILTLFICRSILFSSHKNLLKVLQLLQTRFSAVVCTSLHCLPAAGNTFAQNSFSIFFKKCWMSLFLYIRRTRILAITYAVFLYVQKRNFNLNLLEPLKD